MVSAGNGGISTFSLRHRDKAILLSSDIVPNQDDDGFRVRESATGEPQVDGLSADLGAVASGISTFSVRQRDKAILLSSLGKR